MISNKTTGPVVSSEEIIVSALRAIRCTVSGSALASLRVLECYSAQLFENMSSTTDSGLLRSMVLLSMVQTLLNTPEDELQKLPRLDFTEEVPLTYAEVVDTIDISLVFKTVLEADGDIKTLVLQESRDIVQRIFQHKLHPSHLSNREALEAAAGSVIASNIGELRAYLAEL